jgi:hypothetical protein
MNVGLMKLLSRVIVGRGEVLLLLTPWNTVLEKLIVSQQLNKFTLLWSVHYPGHKIPRHEPISHLTLFLLDSKNEILACSDLICTSVSSCCVSCRVLVSHSLFRNAAPVRSPSVSLHFPRVWSVRISSAMFVNITPSRPPRPCTSALLFSFPCQLHTPPISP